jgi:two-component system, NtrC family, sensor kinase
MFNKIRFKLIFAVGITTIIIISIYSYINIVSQSDALLKEVEGHAHQLSETIKSSTHQYMLANHRENLHESINAVGKHLGICGIRIFNKEGEIIYSAKNDEIGEMVNKRAESCYVCHAENKPMEKLPLEDRTRIFRLGFDKPRGLGVINPIYNESSCWEADCHAHSPQKSVLGVLDVTICLTDVDEQIKNAKIKGVSFAFIAIAAISIIIGIFVKKMVDEPVKEILNATNYVASGNLNYTIKNLGDDELGTLAHSFNHMTEKLSEMRQLLFQSDKMASLGRLVAGIAHELNNPLTGVLTYSSFLLKRTHEDSETKKDLEVIVRETKRSREIVKGLLDFARQSNPKKSQVNINQIIDHAISVVSNQLTIHNIKLTKEYDANLPLITVDENQIQQVFLNLLVNAIDAIGNCGGKIIIKSSILDLSPFGITQIKHATCPNQHDLIDSSHKIEGMPSIKVKVSYKGNVGFLHLDPIYGGLRHHYGIQLKKNESIEVSCPECDVSLVHPTKKCLECGSPIYVLYTPETGSIEGCARHSGTWRKWEQVDREGKSKYIEVQLIDNGKGIPAEIINDVFEPFFSNKGQKGTGLGLSVIWGIIDNHDGTISVHSKINKGSTFTVRLPVNVETGIQK